MKIMKSISAKLAGAFLLAFSAGSHGATADTLPEIPGIAVAGNPSFVNQVTLGLSEWNGGFKLTATGTGNEPFLFQLGSDSYEVLDGSYQFTAYFDQDANLDTTRSNVQVRGTFSDEALDALSGTERQHELWGGNLFSARIDDVGLNLDGGELVLGFSITDFGGWASQWGVTESIWLYDFNPSVNNLFAFLNSLNNGTLEATAITTVPLPAGIWLLGSALMGFRLFARRQAAVDESQDFRFGGLST